jgi:L-seryl-tRNA(Ser) seleniumtransferase
MNDSTAQALALGAKPDIRRELGLRPIINASGTMTVLGASIMVPEAIAAMADIAGEFVEMQQLHQLASEAVVSATGAEAGFITASCASAITLAVAATLTGDRLLAIDQTVRLDMPDSDGRPREVRAKVRWRRDLHYGVVFDDTFTLGEFARLAARLQAPALLEE